MVTLQTRIETSSPTLRPILFIPLFFLLGSPFYSRGNELFLMRFVTTRSDKNTFAATVFVCCSHKSYSRIVGANNFGKFFTHAWTTFRLTVYHFAQSDFLISQNGYGLFLFGFCSITVHKLMTHSMKAAGKFVHIEWNLYINIWVWFELAGYPSGLSKSNGKVSKGVFRGGLGGSCSLWRINFW